MIAPLKRHGFWLALWALGTLVIGVLLGQAEIARQTETFNTDARIAHRLLSQRAVQHDAILATLALLRTTDANATPEKSLPSVYPQILAVHRSDDASPWPEAAQRQAQQESIKLGRAVVASANLAQQRFQLLLAAQPTSYALDIDLHAMVPWSEWPMAPETSAMRITLAHADQSMVLQPGTLPPQPSHGWHLEAHKVLASPSQAFAMTAQQHVPWSALPWAWTAGCALAWGALLWGARLQWQQRAEQQRNEERLRLGQVARLNTLGELAAGMAHELNQPLTAVLANTQAARRMLHDDPPDLAASQAAMEQAVQQARRASDVVGRLRRAVERPGTSGTVQSLNLHDAVRKVLYVLEPELARSQVIPVVHAPSKGVLVLADAVAVEQILHNLMNNALQALEAVPANQRELQLTLSASDAHGQVRVQDNGMGLAPEVLPHVFEPFFTTREGGLGLGLSLCETLASGMGGSLLAANAPTRGAVFTLQLPLAPHAS